MNRFPCCAGVAGVVALAMPASATITFDSGLFSTNGNSINGNINDGGPLTGWGTYSRFATDGSTLTMDATSSLDPSGIHDLGWTMTYTDTEGFNTATGFCVTFTVVNPVDYSFAGTLETSSNTPVYTYSDVWLWDLTLGAGVFWDNAQWTDTPFVSHVRTPDGGSFSGSLDPGHQYQFNMYLQTGVDTVSTNATFSATFDLVLMRPLCPWDCQATPNGTVDVLDLLALLATWGGPGSCDFDADGTVAVLDLLKLLANWGACP